MHHQNFATPQQSRFDFPKATLADHHALKELPVKWVKTADELYQLIDEIDGVDVIALDTEFIKRTTYYPILALIQVNTGSAIYLIDAPKLDLREFWEALIEVPTMVWYACGEDLGIFYLLADCPPLTNVFDVQIGISYLTGKLQVGYAQAINEVLGIDLDKAQSQSDWLVRPLTKEQEQYAANDVRYLLALYGEVKKHLKLTQVLDYVIEDSNLYAHELHQTANIKDSDLYLEFSVPTYTPHQIGALQLLVAWRESLARSINEPRTFIIGRQPLREIIDTMPKTIKALARTTINRASLRKYGDEIIRIIKTASTLPVDSLPIMPPPTYRSKEKTFKKPLDQAIEAYSQAINVPPNLILKGRWINELLNLVAFDLPKEQLSKGLQGYRHAWVVDVVIPLLQEHKAQIISGFECGTIS
ncbi:HRDC domain-containing protein [Moraxella nasovis]|uniref:ribonuclease D n=1 Tax=Moraxella nasovis TaxID=2904121 RepID=UPI001F611A4F|nr:HRDC domain-containing protein [Moraxella nasovis]UNU73445.1 HRDC domain-containing protein [Moraxella nasovis]